MKACNADIKERIVQTTCELLRRHGLKGWNMDVLAHEASLAKNTLYKIIGSKENLLEQAILSKMRQDLHQIRQIIKEEKDYATAVNRMTDKFADLTKNNFDTVIPSIYREYPTIEKRVKASQREITAFIIDFIQDGIAMGLIRDDMTPEFILDLIEGIILHYFQSSLSGAEFKKAFRCAMDCLINGLRKQVTEKS